MADVKWTKEQLDAINVRNSKVLVAAGAGSGKTAVLVERIIRKVIDDKIDIDKMLIVTFTNAAASEMKERIRARLYDEVANNPSLQKQILYLNRSSIMTIDAFCKKAIKDYFYKIDIDPNFKIADNTENELLRLEAIDEVLEELYEQNDVNVIEVLDAYSTNRSDENLINLILSIHRFIQSCPKPLEWLAEKCDMYNVDVDDFSDTPWGKMLIDYTRKTIREVIDELKTVEEELIAIPDAANYLLTIQDDIFRLEALRKNNFKWDDYYEEFRKIEFSQLKRAPKLDEDTRKYVQDARKKMKGLMDDYFKEKVFISTSDEILNDIEYVYSNLNVIYSIVKAFDERFKKKKADKNLLDFSDIEHLCLKLFEENDDVVDDFKNKYSEILIDEYQDSNLIQEEILTKIANDSVFMVGDVKQSIYKFRQAKPELFLEKYNSYPNYDEDVQCKENKILLFKNFRSNQNIIDEVNFIFKNIMFKETGEIDYTEKEYLKFGASYYPVEGKTAELHIIDKKVSEESLIDDDDIEEKPQLEARVVAKRIEELVGVFEVYDKETKCMRKARYSDIVILLRATKGYTDTLQDELSLRNIPVYVDVKSGYFENAEVQIILSLLKIIDNPYQDVPLLAVLRSPIGNFDVNELTKIRMYDKKCSFYDALLIAMSNGDAKVKAFIDRLNVWREKSRYQAIDEFISYLYENTGYYYYVSLLPHGESRQNNLKVLLKKASEYSKSTFKGLYNFLTFIENVKTSSGDFDAPSELSEADDVVRIMSIHKSKGLEFPIVFLCGTGRKFNTKDLSNKIIFHQDLGLGVDIINVKKRITYESIPKLAIKLQNQKELLAEEMRILYVAMTRAREKLIITALTQNLEKRFKEWESPISMYGISTAKSYADWICKVALSIKNDWDVKEWSYDDVLNIDDVVIKKLENSVTDAEYDDLKEKVFIDGRINWMYPYITSTKLPTKLSVSELKRLNNIYDYTESQSVRSMEIPSFINEDEAVGAVYGTLLHNKMEKLDFERLNVDEVLEDVDDIDVRKKLYNDINKFLNSQLFSIIKGADKIYKEIPFNLNVSVKNIFGVDDASASDEIMVQGIIDLYAETQEGYIVVDYKSDHLFNSEEFKARYQKQLEYYKLALETMTGKKVLGTYIYSFSMEKEIKIV